METTMSDSLRKYWDKYSFEKIKKKNLSLINHEFICIL